MTTTHNKNFNSTLNELLIYIKSSIIDDDNQTEEKKEQFIKENNILNDYITESKKIYNNLYNKIFKTFEEFIKSSLSDTYRSKI